MKTYMPEKPKEWKNIFAWFAPKILSRYVIREYMFKVEDLLYSNIKCYISKFNIFNNFEVQYLIFVEAFNNLFFTVSSACEHRNIIWNFLQASVPAGACMQMVLGATPRKISFLFLNNLSWKLDKNFLSPSL